jgi:hypothetical protein
VAETLSKPIGWRTALFAVVTDAMGRPFKWGSNDCVTFAAGCIQAQIGIDRLAAYRGKYTTAAGALRVIKQAGHASLLDMLKAELGEPMDLPKAHVGDVALLASDAPGGVGWACGIFLGERVGVMAPAGYATIERRLAQYAFKV